MKPFKAFPDLRHDLSNGLTLCNPCHRKTDTYGWTGYWKKKRLAQEMLPLEAPAKVSVSDAYLSDMGQMDLLADALDVEEKR